MVDGFTSNSTASVLYDASATVSYLRRIAKTCSSESFARLPPLHPVIRFGGGGVLCCSLIVSIRLPGIVFVGRLGIGTVVGVG